MAIILYLNKRFFWVPRHRGEEVAATLRKTQVSLIPLEGIALGIRQIDEDLHRCYYAEVTEPLLQRIVPPRDYFPQVAGPDVAMIPTRFSRPQARLITEMIHNITALHASQGVLP